MGVVAKRAFLITFAVIGHEGTGVHRTRNWAEDVQRDIGRHRFGNVENPDTATDKVWIRMSSPRVRGDLAGAIQWSLRHHNLLEDAVVARVSDLGDG